MTALDLIKMIYFSWLISIRESLGQQGIELSLNQILLSKAFDAKLLYNIWNFPRPTGPLQHKCKCSGNVTLGLMQLRVLMVFVGEKRIQRGN